MNKKVSIEIEQDLTGIYTVNMTVQHPHKDDVSYRYSFVHHTEMKNNFHLPKVINVHRNDGIKGILEHFEMLTGTLTDKDKVDIPDGK